MNPNSNLLVVVFTTLGTLFMLAMAFSVLPRGLAIFAGCACYVIAGAVRKLAPRNG